MKKLISAFIILSMLSALLLGCADHTDNSQDSGSEGEAEGGTDTGTESGDGSSLDEGNDAPNTETDTEQASDGNEGSDEGGNNATDPSGDNGKNDSTADNGEGEPTDDNGETQESIPVGTDVGNRFNDLALQTLDGSHISTEDYRGKILVLNIWATWCPPCKAELPDFDRIASEYADDVVIIAAHVPSGREDAPTYVQTNFPDSKIVFAYDTDGLGAFLAAGGDGGIPRTVVIDEDGIILYGQTGMMSYEQLVELITK